MVYIMQPEYHVRLKILDESLLPEQITEQLGICPSKTWHKGDLVPNTSIRKRENGWEIESTLPKEVLPSEHIQHILSVIKPAYFQFQDYSQKYYCELSCAIYFDEERPDIFLDKNLMRQLADLNLNLDIDIYNVEC